MRRYMKRDEYDVYRKKGEKMKENFFTSLTFKILLSVVLSIGIIAGTSFFGIYIKQKRKFIDMETEKAELLASSIVSSLESAMQSGRPEDVQSALKNIIAENPDKIKDIAVYSHKWQRTFSAVPLKRKTFVNRQEAEECRVCHSLPVEERPRSVIVKMGDSNIIRGVMPIRKREMCKKCHPQKERLRGMLLVDMDAGALSNFLSSNMIWVFSAGGLTFIALIAVIIISINKLLTNPIGRLTKDIKRISSGDLSHKIDDGDLLGRNDIIGILSHSINDLISSISTIISKIFELTSKVDSITNSVVSMSKDLSEAATYQKSSALETFESVEQMSESIEKITKSVSEFSSLSDETASSVVEMASATEEVSENAEGLFNAVDDTTTAITQMLSSIKEIANNTQGLSATASETAASMNEIDASTKEIENNANTSGELSIKVSTDAEKGFTAVEETVKVIKETSGIINSLGTNMENLLKRSKEISKILNIIDQISGQTNLLALNASIISAQAGEHGKSFGVVASEIKKLSEQTATSTKDIAELIKAVQLESQKATENMQIGDESIKNSVSLAVKAGKTLEAILESSKKSATTMQGIVKATEEQSRGTGYVTQAIEGVKDMVDRIANATQEQSIGAENISKQINVMKDLTSYVKKATLEQSKGSKQVSESTFHINERIKRIKEASDNQKEESKKAIESIDKIAKITEEHLEKVKAIETSVSTLSEQIRSLTDELGRFKL